MQNVTTGVVTVLAADSGGGAALDQVFGMTAVAAVVSIGLLWIAYRHRTRKSDWLDNLARWIGAVGERPTWSVLPVFLFTSTILTAFLGFIWDVSLHVGRGRDEGPLANPAHYFILVGLFFLFIAGSLAMILPRNRDGSVAIPGKAAIKITRTWYSPVAGILVAACGLYALIGFPLDDIWHRIFGQDVTLWGPTHLMLIGGAGFSLIGVILLIHEGYLAAKFNADPDIPSETSKLGSFEIPAWISGPFPTKLAQSVTCGGLLIGLSVFQVEFDFGVEQFRLLFQPILLVAAGVFGTVVCRLWAGPGSTFIAVAFAAIVREIVALLVGPAFGEPHNVFPLYLAIAIIVEPLALTPLRNHAIAFGGVAGVLGATVGAWGESLWVNRFFQIPWPKSLWPDIFGAALPVAIAVGLTAGLLVRALQPQPLPPKLIRRSIVITMIATLACAIFYGLNIKIPNDATASVTLHESSQVDGFRMVTADVVVAPSNTISDDPDWVTILAWQGGGDTLRGLVIDRLDRVAPGHFRSTKPVPVSGGWKTVFRVQDGDVLTAAPIYLAGDPQINAPEVPATASFTRPLQREIDMLQRERKFDHPAWLFSAATWAVAVMTIILVWVLSWGAARINESYFGSESRSRRSKAADTPAV